ncbi:MAG: 2-oxoacid:acceptor oxidoreductase family protein [Ferrimicrobium sp.]
MEQLKSRDLVRIRLTGRGGQGIILAGAILAEAAMRDGKHVVETHEYGPEARLGATKSDIIVSRRFIAFPEVIQADVLLCLSREGFLRYGRNVSPGGLRILDSGLRLKTGDGDNMAYLPLKETAKSLGNEVAINIVGLGALAGLSGLVSEDSVHQAVLERVKAEFRSLNEQALKAGFELATQSCLQGSVS